MQDNKVEPTTRGKEEYNDSDPPGYYEDHPCTCTKDCPSVCKGQCGCKACSACYSDFLSGE